MEEYNDENIGNLADDMDDAMPTEGDQWLIQSAVQDFEDNFTFNTQRYDMSQTHRKLCFICHSRVKPDFDLG